MEEFELLPQQPEQEQEPASRPGAGLFEWLQIIVGCVLVMVLLINCAFRLSQVKGSSMDNTLQDGELILLWSLGYQPRQGDIVVLNKTPVVLPGWSRDEAIVKRVIAVEGQTVDIDYSAGLVYVDGQPLDEPYIREAMYLPFAGSMQDTHWEVPEDSVFVLGDNRNESTDSRYDGLGCIHSDYILGKAVMALWPMGRFGPL